VGDGIANLWDEATTNWLNAAVPDTFTNGNFVTFDDTGSTTPAVNLVGPLAPNSVTVDAGGDYVFGGSGKITGAAVLIKANTGSLTVLTTNDYSGLTIINSGTLQIGNGSVSGALGTNVIQDNGALIWNLPGNFSLATGVTGAGKFVQAGGGVTTLSASNSYSGETTISGGTLQIGSGGVLGGGNITNNAALVFNSSANSTLNQLIAGTGSLMLLGSGTVTLTANNFFSGGSSVSNGTLMVNNTAGSGTGSGAVTVFSGGKLAGGGAIAGPVTINSGGTLMPGNLIGTLTINNTLTVNPGAILSYSLGTTSDRTIVNGNLNLSGTLNVANSGGLIFSNYTLFTYTGALSLGNLTVGTMPVGFAGTISTNTPGKVELITSFAPTSLPAFPGAEGAGAYAAGGRGGDVYHVVNLNSSGAGSFANGVGTVPASGRTIVFDVSGYIHISGTLTLNSSKVTIAGQTAPGDGIGFKDGTFNISSSDVIVRHVRFRDGNSADAADLDSDVNGCMMDHCDVMLSNDENLSSFSSPPDNFTFQWCMNSWGMETHSAGGLWDQQHATGHHSLWSHNHTRNPKARPDGCLDWINNVTFDWDIGFIMGDSTTPADWKANIRGCYFVCPPGNIRSVALETATLDRNGNPNFTIYIDDCKMDDNGNGLLDFNPAKAGYALASGDYAISPAPIPNNGIPVMRDDPLTAYKKIVSAAGPLRLDASPAMPLRDEINTILVSNLVNQIAHHVSSPAETGAANGGFGFLNSTPNPTDTDGDGMPDFLETATGSNPNADDHNNPIPLDAFLPNGMAGYTLLEDYLYFLALPHTTVSNQTFVDIDLRKFTSGFTSAPVFTFTNVSNGAITLQPNGYTARFAPTTGYTGRARFDFTVTDADGSAWTQTFAALVINPPPVPPSTPPAIGSINLSGGNLIVSGSGGPTNGTYYVLTTTNVALPVNNWTRIATNPFTATGTFIFTNDFSPGTPQQFYRLQLP
jgi:autotransporter-associated beta strand protein